MPALTNQSFVIRPATSVDAQVIADLESNWFGKHAFSPSQINYYRRRAHAMILVTEDKAGEIAGYLIGSLDARHRAPSFVLLSMGIRHDLRGHHLGRRLCRKALQYARQWNALFARLQVSVENLPAINLYHAVGFSVERTVSDYYGPGLDAWEMDKSLS